MTNANAAQLQPPQPQPQATPQPSILSPSPPAQTDDGGEIIETSEDTTLEQPEDNSTGEPPEPKTNPLQGADAIIKTRINDALMGGDER